jgi:PIN domain nuclease of toxin-antitoxin system
MKILLDTCAIIWVVSQPEKLTNKARDILLNKDSEIFVSSISCAEIACAVERGRIKLNTHWKKWFRHYIQLNGWYCVDIDLQVIEEAFSIPGIFHNDPADRILVATARLFSAKLLTADKKMLEYPHVDCVWD